MRSRRFSVGRRFSDHRSERPILRKARFCRLRKTASRNSGFWFHPGGYFVSPRFRGYRWRGRHRLTVAVCKNPRRFRTVCRILSIGSWHADKWLLLGVWGIPIRRFDRPIRYLFDLRKCCWSPGLQRLSALRRPEISFRTPDRNGSALRIRFRYKGTNPGRRIGRGSGRWWGRNCRSERFGVCIRRIYSARWMSRTKDSRHDLA